MCFGINTCFYDKFDISTYNGWPGVISIIRFATRKDARLARSVFGSLISQPEQVLVITTGACTHGANVTGLATTIFLLVSSVEAVA